MKFQLGIAASTLVLAAIITTSCGHKGAYNLKGEFDPNMEGKEVLVISMVNGDTIATTNITDGAFLLTGEVEKPTLVQVRVGGRSVGNVILEDGDIAFSPKAISGTPLNDILNEYVVKNAQAEKEYYALLSDTANDNTAAAQAIEVSFNAYTDSFMNANLNNPVGASLMLNQAYYMELAEIEKAIADNPSLGEYKKIQSIVESKKLEAETAEGQPYKDFAVEYDGATTKLSDLMTDGHYTLVDFWASWCGPCRREIPVIKDILAEYGPQGLNVVGVAVWDKPEDTVEAMSELEITWPVIINAQTVPTDLYGILGIPTILLIGPDGTILSRGKQGDDLKAAVAEAMQAK